VLVEAQREVSVQEYVEDDSFMNSALSFFGKAKTDKTSILTKGHEDKIDPIFILLLDAIN
jgi:hypothetical protein